MSVRSGLNNIQAVIQNIWINAIDGTVIDMEKEGNAIYFTEF